MVQPRGQALLCASNRRGNDSQVKLSCPDAPAVLNETGNLLAAKLDFYGTVHGLRMR